MRSSHRDNDTKLTPAQMCIINNITVIVTWSYVPSPSPPLPPPLSLPHSAPISRIRRADEAGAYLATYKRFEHKPPTMIKERIEKEPGAILRAALTSISKVNKTDVETLRTTFGVRSSSPFPTLPSCSHPSSMRADYERCRASRP